MLKVDEKVLKGRFIIAQGKRRRSVALGCGMESEIVRGEKWIKVVKFFSDGIAPSKSLIKSI